MALDSAAKRASSISTCDLDFGYHLPSAGGVNSAGERQAIAYSYSGIGGSAPVVITYLPKLDRRRRGFAAWET